MTWLLVALSLGVAVAFGFLWRRTVVQMRSREQLWREALRTLAARDYGGAQRLAALPVAHHELATVLRETASALKASTDEQERARRNLEDVLAALQDAVLVVDGEGHLRYLNSTALQLFNVRIEDVLGAALLEALPSFGLESAVRTALHEGVSTSREVGLYASPTSTQSGSALAGKREILLRAAPVRRGDGTVSGAVAILQDLTEMRRLERVRREFVANASHELRTPIANIRAGAETILSNPQDTTLAERFLPHLVTESERLSRLVSDLLDLARIEAAAEITGAPVDLSAVAGSVVQRLKEKATGNNIALHCDLDENVRVPGDAAALEQVIFNLLDNALAYTPAHGTISLRVALAESAVPGLDSTSRARVPNTQPGDSAPTLNGVLNGVVRYNGAAHYDTASHRSHDGVNGAVPAVLLPGALRTHLASGAYAENGASSADNSLDDTLPPIAPAAGTISWPRKAIFCIRDTGIGIPPADQERVFERFYRVDKARSRTQGGTGLGLAIVKHIVENHGGHITVQSEVGQGTTFNVTLPAL